MVVHFKIDHLDQFGQGVYKQNSDVFFIPKTLPGEEGEARILKKKKGVFFCHLETLDPSHSSLLRKDPACPHFQSCSGCHYLHTNYEEELNFKRQTLERIVAHWEKKGLKKVSNTHKISAGVEIADTLKVQVHPSPQKSHYRNRLQLHYDENKKKLGLIQSSGGILEIPHCQLPFPQLSKRLQHLYHQNGHEFWLERKKGRHPHQGHVELTANDRGEVEMVWNKPYASGGFTQVNSEVNVLIQHYLLEKFQKEVEKNENKKFQVMDLFGGKGNLTKKFSESEFTSTALFLSILIADIYGHNSPGLEQTEHSTRRFANLDLYSDQDFQRLLAMKGANSPALDLLVIDPPRSGWTFLREFCQHYSPQAIFYLSCDPQTLSRDIISLQESYQIASVALFDMFPGTFHLETLVVLQRNIS